MVKKYKPTTPGRRQLVLPSKEEISTKKNKPLKSLLKIKKSSSGRNNHGHITSRHRGGGHKKRFRVVDFKRNKEGIPAKVQSIEYDPNRTAHIARVAYKDGEKAYILAHRGIKVGDLVYSGPESPIKNGNCMPLSKMPVGSIVFNIELYPGRGGVMVRSAGGSAQLMARTAGKASLKMPSGEVRLVLETCRATIGAVSNVENNLTVIGKAGRNRWKGKRPLTRGTSKNPVDHPHGGGEGKHNSYHPRSPWGTLAKGYRTRARNKSKKMIVKDRRQK